MTGKQWLIKSNEEIDDDTGNNLYWSNEYGWVNKEEATPFTSDEKDKFDSFCVHTVTGEVEWEPIET